VNETNIETNQPDKELNPIPEVSVSEILLITFANTLRTSSIVDKLRIHKAIETIESG
jgi:hypothetical protein